MVAAKRLTELSEERVQMISKALADPRRYEILKQLGECVGTEPMPCGAMRDSVSISPATMSHHMKELEVAGLVRPIREGKFVSYVLEREILGAYLDRLRRDLA
jgi:ArsR family transcriptional regulator